MAIMKISVSFPHGMDARAQVHKLCSGSLFRQGPDSLIRSTLFWQRSIFTIALCSTNLPPCICSSCLISLPLFLLLSDLCNLNLNLRLCNWSSSARLTAILSNGQLWWLIGRFGTFRSKGRGLESRSRRHVGLLGKSFTHSILDASRASLSSSGLQEEL